MNTIKGTDNTDKTARKTREKILITGGAGFIGSHLAARLMAQKRDTEIVILDDFSTGSLKNISHIDPIANNNRISIITGDIRDRKLLDTIMPGTSTVYHLAALLGVDRVIRMPQETWDTEYEGTKAVLETAEKHKVRRFFMASSSECYGKYDTETFRMKESDAITPNTRYGEAKYACEKLCEKSTIDKKVSCVSVRYFNVYGARQSPGGYAVPNFIPLALKGQPLKIYGHGNQYRDFTYIDDAIDATITLCEGPYEGLYNIGSGENISINNLADTIISLTGSPSIRETAPIRRPTDIESKLADITKITKDTGWSPKTTLTDGLKKTVDYYKGQEVFR